VGQGASLQRVVNPLGAPESSRRSALQAVPHGRQGSNRDTDNSNNIRDYLYDVLLIWPPDPIWEEGRPPCGTLSRARGRAIPPTRLGRQNTASPAYTGDMKFRVVLEYDPESHSFSAVCPELHGCASAGDTEAEARLNIEEAIRLYLAPSEINLPENAKLVEVMVG
jgi:predicted RNase H-like HicB family nuclease